MTTEPQLKLMELAELLNGLDLDLLQDRLVELNWLTPIVGGYKPMARTVNYEFIDTRASKVLTKIGIRSLYAYYRHEELPMKDNWDGTITKYSVLKEKLRHLYEEKRIGALHA
jgi:hypothetical protein